MPWAKRAFSPVPPLTSRQATFELNDYSSGFNSFLSNDKFPLKNGDTNMWRLAQNARITTLGEYVTRKGFDFHSDSAGVTQDQAITSTTGADDKAFNATIRIAQKWTAGSNGRLTKYDINIKNSTSATGTVLVEHWTDAGGSPGVLVGRSSIAASSVTASNAYLTARFSDAPSITSATAYWIVVYVQSVASGSYSWSSTTSTTSAKVSTDSGTSWASTSFAMNFRQYYATSGGSKGLHRAYKSDGTKVTLFVQGTTLYSVDAVTGALTAVKSGLSANATRYSFVTVNDIVYYANSYDGLRKWDFATESQVNTTNYSILAVHKGLLFGARADDPNRVDFSNFADYETFTSTDFIYVPSPKTGDPITAIRSLNGYLLIPTRDDKYILSGDDNATFALEEAPDKKGTFTQETTTTDKNFMYYLSNDGVYRTNGSEAQLMSEGNYQDVLTLATKESACMVVNKGRLYLWFRSSGSSINDTCYVWNLNYSKGGTDCLESTDTNAYVAFAISAYNDSNDLLVASSLVGQVYWQEKVSNDTTNLGGDINFLLQTHYMVFPSPAVLKEIRYWQPRFGAQSSNYSVRCEYAYDLRDNWQLYDTPDVQGSGYLWGSSSTVWGSFIWGTTAEVTPKLYVPGEYRRLAIGYKHYATRQPQKFLGHTLVVQTRRLR